jgi:hypothetical protein
VPEQHGRELPDPLRRRLLLDEPAVLRLGLRPVERHLLRRRLLRLGSAVLQREVHLGDPDLLRRRRVLRGRGLRLGAVLQRGHAALQRGDVLSDEQPRLRPVHVGEQVRDGLLRVRPPLLLLGRLVRHRRGEQLVCEQGRRSAAPPASSLYDRRGALRRRMLLHVQLLLQREVHRERQQVLRGRAVQDLLLR